MMAQCDRYFLSVPLELAIGALGPANWTPRTALSLHFGLGFNRHEWIAAQSFPQLFLQSRCHWRPYAGTYSRSLFSQSSDRPISIISKPNARHDSGRAAVRLK
jgi:hypothetical protein